MSTVVRQDGQTTAAALPLVLSWRRGENPLPVRPVRVPGRSRAAGFEAPPWHESGPAGRPFDFCGHVRRLCAGRGPPLPELAHIDVARLLFGMTQARSGRRHGLQARVTPLRFHDGRLDPPPPRRRLPGAALPRR